MQKKYNDSGLTILGFPCDQFAHQEPGSDPTIKKFAEKYGILQAGGVWFHKIDVNGANEIPVYKWLKQQAGIENIKWNFEKFVLARNGSLVGNFKTSYDPLKLEPLIQQLLADKP